MGQEGSLHLMSAPGSIAMLAYAPVDQLHRSIQLTVTVNGSLIGKLVISSPGIREYQLQAPNVPGGSFASIQTPN
jgi:hypothetical protein